MLIDAAREHLSRLCALPGAMYSGFMHFAAFDLAAYRAFLTKSNLAMQVSAIGG